jgi:glycerol-3-phosphate acyltransferase PlsY
MASVLINLAIAAGSYLLGSVSFGVLVARMAGLGDLRQIGSGNIGATNVLRTGNRGAALATLLGDGGKGALAVLIGHALTGETGAAIAAAGAFLGHLYPVFLGFKGGKGVATFLGTALALNFPAGIVACATWLLVAFFTRYSSLSALIAAALAPVYLGVSHHRIYAQVMACLALLLFYRHRANIRRLVEGTEPKIGAKKPDAS